MDTLSVLLPLSEGNPPATGGFPSQRAGNAGFDVILTIVHAQGIAYFYVGNAKVVDYLWNRVWRIQILYKNLANDVQKDTVKIKSENDVFSFIDVYPGRFIHWRNRIQI